MGVELRGDAFEVMAFSPSEQLVLRIDSPEIAGGRIAVPVLEREIQIQIDIVFGARRFVATNWQ